MATIYKILSPCLQECYVGSTVYKVEYRWSQHRGEANDCRSKRLFENYGIENCKFVVMEVCLLEERREKEQWWMDHSVGLVNKNCVIQNEEDVKMYRKEWQKGEKAKQYQKLYRESCKEKQKQYQKLYRLYHKKE